MLKRGGGLGLFWFGGLELLISEDPDRVGNNFTGTSSDSIVAHECVAVSDGDGMLSIQGSKFGGGKVNQSG
jgi:hypothetical protein